jgi:CheY-like chemotaxis protein
MKILAIDDDQIMLNILAKHFGYKGVEFVACSRGFEGLSAIEMALAQKKPFQVVLLDVHMPHVSGLFILEQLRKLEQEVYVEEGRASTIVCMLTSDNSSSVVLEAFDDDCDGFLTKPLSLDKLDAFLKRQNAI